MGQRILFGTLMLAAMVALLAADHRLQRDGRLPAGLATALLVGVVVAAGSVELARMARAADLPVMAGPAGLAAVALAAAPVWGPRLFVHPADLWLLATPALLILAFFWQMARWRLDRPAARIAATVLIAAYLGTCGACILSLRLEYGVPVLVVFLTAVKVTDIGAYFTGTWLGRHKLIPWLSPGKSWEGLAGGLVAGTAVSLLVWWVLPGPSGTIMDAWQVGLFALAVGLVGQFGDLCESLLKRAASLKDAGRLVPQFGGVMDIIDSPLIAAPVAYALWKLMA